VTRPFNVLNLQRTRAGHMPDAGFLLQKRHLPVHSLHQRLLFSICRVRRIAACENFSV